MSLLGLIDLPHSFPFNFMHLIFENLIPNLIHHYTSDFKDLNCGTEDYQLPKSLWEAICKAGAKLGNTIPSCFGAQIPNLKSEHSHMTTKTWSFWAMYLGPALLKGKFLKPKYYKHFTQLVDLVHLCVSFKIKWSNIEVIRAGFIKWVEGYERYVSSVSPAGNVLTGHVCRMFYQYDNSQLSVCPLTIRALLHIANGIDAAGPVWCYWSFVMEWFCRAITQGNKNWAKPYASLDCHMWDMAQLQMVKIKFGLLETLSLWQPEGELDEDVDTFDGCACHIVSFVYFDVTKIHLKMMDMLSFRQGRTSLSTSPSCWCWLLSLLPSTALMICNSRFQLWRQKCASQQPFNSGARSKLQVGGINSPVLHWLSLEGTHMIAHFLRCVTGCGSSLVTPLKPLSQYRLQVDEKAQQNHQSPSFKWKTFFGELQCVVALNVPWTLDLDLSDSETIILALVKTCNMKKGADGLWQYTRFHNREFVDLTVIKCLVGQVWDDKEWVIVDCNKKWTWFCFEQDVLKLSVLCT